MNEIITALIGWLNSLKIKRYQANLFQEGESVPTVIAFANTLGNYPFVRTGVGEYKLLVPIIDPDKVFVQATEGGAINNNDGARVDAYALPDGIYLRSQGRNINGDLVNMDGVLLGSPIVIELYP